VDRTRRAAGLIRGPARRVAFLQHGPLESPGVLGTHAASLGFDVHCQRADRVDIVLPEPEQYAAVVVLGSVQSTNDPGVEWVAQERAFVTSAIERAVPVFGVCFGGQLLAQALGGRVVPSPQPEAGWSSITSEQPSLVATGPWLLWHNEAVELPPGAVLLARNEVAIQAYAKGPHLGVQFHPEVTPAIVDSWINDAKQRDEVTEDEHRALWDGIEERARTSGANARTLFDGFLRRAGLLDPSD
jgi:GMP synthase (glutamine-hydrolysing)